MSLNSVPAARIYFRCLRDVKSENRTGAILGFAPVTEELQQLVSGFRIALFGTSKMVREQPPPWFNIFVSRQDGNAGVGLAQPVESLM